MKSLEEITLKNKFVHSQTGANIVVYENEEIVIKNLTTKSSGLLE